MCKQILKEKYNGKSVPEFGTLLHYFHTQPPIYEENIPKSAIWSLVNFCFSLLVYS